MHAENDVIVATVCI